MAAHRLLQTPEGHLLIPRLGQEQINRLTLRIHRAILPAPRPFDAAVGLVHAPAHPDRVRMAVARRLQWGLSCRTLRLMVAWSTHTPRASRRASTWRERNG